VRKVFSSAGIKKSLNLINRIERVLPRSGNKFFVWLRGLKGASLKIYLKTAELWLFFFLFMMFVGFVWGFFRGPRQAGFFGGFVGEHGEGLKGRGLMGFLFR
jgi:hypothetical protein